MIEQRCQTCRGSQIVFTENVMSDCPACGGAGWVKVSHSSWRVVAEATAIIVVVYFALVVVTGAWA